MASQSSYPYNYDPNGFIVSALSQPANYTPPAHATPLPSAAVAPSVASYFGPNHQALTQMLQGALMGQAGAPGMTQQMTQNPALAQRLGGFGPGAQTAYTPPMPAYHRLSFNNPVLYNGQTSMNPIAGTQGSGGFFQGGM